MWQLVFVDVVRSVSVRRNRLICLVCQAHTSQHLVLLWQTNNQQCIATWGIQQIRTHPTHPFQTLLCTNKSVCVCVCTISKAILCRLGRFPPLLRSCCSHYNQCSTLPQCCHRWKQMFTKTKMFHDCCCKELPSKLVFIKLGILLSVNFYSCHK